MKHKRYVESYVPPDADELWHWARSGRPDLIVRDMLQRTRTDPWDTEPPQYLWKALDEAAARGSEYLIAAYFQGTFQGYYELQVRLHYVLIRSLREWDRSGYCVEILDPVVKVFLPVMERVHRLFVQAVKQYTAAQRSLDLPPWPEIPEEPALAGPWPEPAKPAANGTGHGEPPVPPEESATPDTDPERSEDVQGLRVHHE